MVGCNGDCGGNGLVSIDELLVAVNIALSRQPLSACPSLDRNASGEVTIDELILAVVNAQTDCVGS